MKKYKKYDINIKIKAINMEEKMRLLLINGSPRIGGTYSALKQAEKALNEEGIETKIINVGNKPINDCISCAMCFKNKNNRCVLENDIVNQIIEEAEKSDGFIFGTPVYYAHPTGRILSILDRVFYAGGKVLKFKPGAAVSCARRAGTITSFDVMNKYFTINQMPIVSSTYWNEIHGNNEEETQKDEEGMQTMYNLGKNMAWLLKCIECGKKNGIKAPENTKKHTNFIK